MKNKRKILLTLIGTAFMLSGCAITIQTNNQKSSQ